METRVEDQGERRRHSREYDSHRAGGLWLWLLLIMMALSGVALNLTFDLFRPIVSAFADLTPSPFALAQQRFRENPPAAKFTFNELVSIAQREAKARGWTQSPQEIFHATNYGAYGAGYGTYEEPGLGVTWLYFDDTTREVLGADPGIHGKPGDVFLQAQYPLHSGRIAGLPGRSLISLLGVAVTILSVSGVAIWVKKQAHCARKSTARAALCVLPGPELHCSACPQGGANDGVAPLHGLAAARQDGGAACRGLAPSPRDRHLDQY